MPTTDGRTQCDQTMEGEIPDLYSSIQSNGENISEVILRGRTPYSCRNRRLSLREAALPTALHRCLRLLRRRLPSAHHLQ